MTKHELKLLGGAGGLRVPAEILLEAMGALLEGARQATRFVVDGESTRKGPRPAWLDAACRMEVTGLTAGSAVIAIEAPTLDEAIPERFGSGGPESLFYGSDHAIAKRNAIDVFAGVLSAAIGGHVDQVLADRPLLDTCVRFVRAAGSAFDGIQLGGLAGPQPRLTFRREDARKIEVLRDETPAPHAVRVTGILDTISATRSDIVVGGVAQDESSGVSALFGTWPGEETEEELLTALEAVG